MRRGDRRLHRQGLHRQVQIRPAHQRAGDGEAPGRRGEDEEDTVACRSDEGTHLHRVSVRGSRLPDRTDPEGLPESLQRETAPGTSAECGVASCEGGRADGEGFECVRDHRRRHASTSDEAGIGHCAGV